MRFTTNIDSNFMLFQFQTETVKAYLEKNATGATMLNINASIVGDMPIMLPSFKEQQAIVERLDGLSARVRELEEINRKTAAECDALKQAILRETFD